MAKSREASAGKLVDSVFLIRCILKSQGTKLNLRAERRRGICTEVEAYLQKLSFDYAQDEKSFNLKISGGDYQFSAVVCRAVNHRRNGIGRHFVGGEGLDEREQAFGSLRRNVEPYSVISLI